MLNLYPSQQIAGLTVFSDSARVDLFYVLPDRPSIRIDENTRKASFKFIKYKNPVGKPDGSKGGGFLIFDSAFVVSADKMKTIQDTLNKQLQSKGYRDSKGQPLQAQIGMPTFVKGTASLTLLDSGGALVTKIEDVGKPSLFGSLICSYTAELSPEGATLLEAVLKGSGGVIQIAYDLTFAAVLPPITGLVWFEASKFYSFYQSIDKSSGYLGSDPRENQTLRESFANSQAGGVSFDFSALGLDASDPNVQKLQESIMNWGWSQIDEAVKTAILPDIKAAEDRGDDGKDHITKVQTTWEKSSFRRYFNQLQGVDFETVQQGTLPNLTDLGFKWQDYFAEVDLNDAFFAQINASVAVNADFQKFGIDSVDVHLEYNKTNPASVQDFHFKKPDDIGHWIADTSNGDMHYVYSFDVNYKDQGQAYKAPTVETDHPQVTVNANDLGIFYVELSVGSIDFAKTPQVQVAIQYPDSDANGQPISQQFTFDKDKKSDTMLAVTLKPVTKPYQAQITYILADGSQLVTESIQHTASQLYINSPFLTKAYTFFAQGDFTNSIDSILLRMKYTDSANNLEQEAEYSFSAANRQHDWPVSVISGGTGQITYSGVISYKNHTTEDIPETTVEKELIEFGPPNQVIVTVEPDTSLVDFTKVKLVKLNIEYADPVNHIDLKHEVLLKQGAAPVPWTFYARDPNKTSYTWQATFYMATTPPTVVQGPSATSSDSDLVVMMPS